MKNYLKESSLVLCFIIHGNGSSEKGLILNCETEINLIAYGFSDTDCVSCLHAHNCL